MEWTPTNKKIAIGVGVGVTILVLYLVLKKNPEGEYLDDPTGNNGNNNTPATFSPILAAERLYDAMKESGTDEKAIMAVFQTVSVSNFPAVFGKFGKRSYNKTLGNQINLIPFTSLPLEPLNVWLKKELSSSSYETLRIKYQSTNLL